MTDNDNGRKWTDPVKWSDPVVWDPEPPMPLTDEQKQEALRATLEWMMETAERVQKETRGD